MTVQHVSFGCRNPECEAAITKHCIEGNDHNTCPNNSPPTAEDFRMMEKVGIAACIQSGDTIKALCWKQPFATLMLSKRGNFLGDKIETRTRPVRYNGLVLIVTTANEYSDKQLISICGGELALKVQLDVAAHTGWCNGHAIAIGHLWKCQRIEDLTEAEKQLTYIRPELWHDRYAWHFKNVFPIEPIAMRGFQGWRNVDDELRSKIKLI